MKVKIGCSINFAGCDREEEIELPDDYTENEIEDAVYEVVHGHFDWQYGVVHEHFDWWYEKVNE